MNTIIKFYLIFIFLCGWFSTNLLAQEESVPRKADSLFEAKSYFKASIEYERLIFQQPASTKLKKYQYRKALCYRYLKRYPDALNELNRISLFNAADTLQVQVLYEKALNLLLTGKQQEALWNIQRIEMVYKPKALNKDIIPLKILVLNNNREWNKAQEALHHLVENTVKDKNKQTFWKDSINQLYNKKNIPKNYSEEKARNWSRFIPGAGQTYAGHFWEGAGSFLLNAAAIGLGIHQLWKGFYFTAYIGGLSIFYKSYFGGMERSANLANLERKNEMSQFNTSTTRLITQILQSE